METKTLSTKTLTERPKRIPLAARNRLNVRDQDPNYVYRIVNANLESDPDRVLALQDAGYEIVPKAIAGEVGDKRVDNTSALGSVREISVGGGTKAILMRQRKEDYQADQDAKQQLLKQQEDSAHKHADYGTMDISTKKSPD
jgi:hypothetical protein